MTRTKSKEVTDAAARKRKAAFDTVEDTTSRQDALNNRLSNQATEPDSRTNAVGRKRQRTEMTRVIELTVADVEPHQLRSLVRTEVETDRITALEALQRFLGDGKPYRKIAQRLYLKWKKPKYAPVPTDPESPEPESEYSEGSIDPDSDSAFSVGEVTPTADSGSGGEPNLRQTRSQEENAKAAERMRSADDDPDAYFLADVRPKALRKAVTAEMKHIRISLKDTIAGFCKPNKPHRKVAQDLFNKWYAPAGAGAVEAKVKPASEEMHAEASLVSDRDDISVGEVTPVVAHSVDQTPEPRSASPDDGPPTTGLWRVEDFCEDEQRLQAKYFQLTHHKASALCLSCGEPFHMDSICPAHTCAHCGTIDEHFSGACPTNRKCGKCRERGHAANTCPRRPVQGGKAGDACDICGRTGHIEEECSGLWRTIGKVDPKRPVQTIPAKAMQKACYNCGSSSHWGDDCTELPDFILEKAGGKGTWSAENANRYVSNGDVRGQQQRKGFGGGRGHKEARQDHYPQAYQLEQLDDY